MARTPPQKQRTRQTTVTRDSAMRASLDRARKRRQLIALVVVAAMGLSAFGAIVAIAFGGGTTADPTTTTTTVPGQEDTAATVEVALPPAGEHHEGETACPAEDGSSPRTTSFEQAPPVCVATTGDGAIDTDVDYRAIVTTSAGDLEFLLTTERAPETINNFVVLARYGFFDDVPFDRNYARSWAEAGGLFAGDDRGPGYTLPRESPEGGIVPTPGMLAMVPAGDDGSDGGRLVIATGDQAAALPESTTFFGLLLDGSEALQELSRSGSETGAPTSEITIEHIEITAADTDG